MMPDVIELPTAEDFCRGEYKGTHGTYCFIGWKKELFPNMTLDEAMWFTTNAVIEGKKLKFFNGGITSSNDDKRNTLNQLAKWFERTVARMGYDIS